MKLSVLRKHKIKLFKLKILKTKINKSQKNFNCLLFKDMEIRLKKILHIIYKFHINNKKILFIGTPLKLNNQVKHLLNYKKHSFIPESIWMSGVVTNSHSSFKHLIKRHAIDNSDKTTKFLFGLKNQADLIVILNENLNLTALTESSLKRVPTVSLNTSYIFDSNLSTYKVPGDYSFNEKKNRNNLFFLLLSSVLKKAEIIKKRQIRINVKKLMRKENRNQIYYKYNAFSKKK